MHKETESHSAFISFPYAEAPGWPLHMKTSQAVNLHSCVDSEVRQMLHYSLVCRRIATVLHASRSYNLSEW